MVALQASTPPTGARKSTSATGFGGTPSSSRILVGGISYPSSSTTSIPSPLPVDMTRVSSSASTATTISMRSQPGFSNFTTPSTSTGPSLPPKSPASINGRRLLSVGSAGSSTCSSHNNGRGRKSRGRSRSKSRSSRRSSSRGSRKDVDSLDHDDSEQLPILPANAGSVSVDTDSDDLSCAEDVSQITFNTKPNTAENALATVSPTSVAYPLTGMSDLPLSGLRHPQQQQRRYHRRNRSWDSLVSSDEYGSSGAAASKSCLALPKILQRNRHRVQVADVASVGNASDTLVPAENGRITGRELHESAKALLNDGDYEQALNMFSAILNAQIDRFGCEEHSSVGAALHNVGVVRLRMGDHMIAEEVLLRAAAIRRRVLGSDHLDLAATLAKLGSARTALEKFDEGLSDLREALKITKKALGRSHRTVAQVLCHIACLYFEADEMFSAQNTFEDALEIYREIFQVDSDRDACMAQMTETLCNIGTIQNRRRNFSGAIESFREALDLQRGITGHDHPRVIASLDNLGYSFSKSKLYNQALACYREMLNAQVSLYGSFTIECCDTLKKQVLLYGKLKNTDGAEQAVTSYLIQAKAKEPGSIGDPVVMELEQMLADLKSAKRKARSKNKDKTKKGPRDRSLDCFDRILFDKRRQAEF